MNNELHREETYEHSSTKKRHFLKRLLLIFLLLVSGAFFISFYAKTPPNGPGVTGINPEIPQELKYYNFNPDKYKKE